MEGNKYDEGAIFLVDKPHGWSSFGAVKVIRRLTKAKKVGHAGTLDPLATGLLILCSGKFTKRITEFQDLTKVYTGTFVLGETTASFDLETPIVKSGEWASLSEELIYATAAKFEGEQLQTPPIYSAAKIEGVRAYKKARLGEEVKMRPKTIIIDHFEITSLKLPEVHFKITCGKGTYIRSLARDFGEALGCGAYMSELRRESIGEFRVDEAKTPAEWEDLFIHQEAL